jgi:capsid protein
MVAGNIAAACGTIDVDPRYANQGVNIGNFGYDAATSEGKRRPATGVLRSEDHELPPHERRKLQSQARDLPRNFPAAGWMIRRHLDYVSTFNFQAKTGNQELNRLIERKMAAWSRPENCDIAGRLSFSAMIRMAESRAVVDGDCGLHLLRDGRLQGIESDRIRTPIGGLPPEVDPNHVVHGVLVDDRNRALQYCITRRSKASDFSPNGQDFQFERMLSAKQLYLHGYFERFDQVRGISPLAPAVNSLVDLYEGIDLALCRMKIHQLFALAFYRGDPTSIAPDQERNGTDYTQLLLGKRPLILDMDIGDRAEFLESKTPSSEFQAFTQLLLQLTLKALDIPYSFFAENFTNYSGARQALLQYEQSAQIKRMNVRLMLDFLTAWRLRLFMLQGELPIVPLEQLGWEWVASGIPWIDPLKEIQGDLAALSGGLTTRTKILKARGENFEENARTLAAENELLESLGLPTNVSPDNALIREMAANAD